MYSYVSSCIQGSNCIRMYLVVSRDLIVFTCIQMYSMYPDVFICVRLYSGLKLYWHASGCIQRQMYSDVSECIQCIQLYLGHKLYLYVSGCFQGSNCTQMYQNVSRCNHMYLSVFKCICRYPKYPSVFKSVQLCMNVSKCIRMYLNVFACIQMCSLCLAVF